MRAIDTEALLRSRKFTITRLLINWGGTGQEVFRFGRIPIPSRVAPMRQPLYKLPLSHCEAIHEPTRE